MRSTSPRLAVRLLAFVMLASPSLGSTNVTLWAYTGSNGVVDIAPGCVGKVVSFNATLQNNLSAYASLSASSPIGTNAQHSIGIDYAQYCTNKQPPVITGPATIFLGAYQATAMATVEISELGGLFAPPNCVVIPSDSGGPVNIILESSADLINWYPSLPGAYGANYTNRFFRVRAQRSQ